MITTIVFTTTRDIGERRVLIDGVCAVHYLYLLKKLPKLHFRPYHLVIFFFFAAFQKLLSAEEKVSGYGRIPSGEI